MIIEMLGNSGVGKSYTSINLSRDLVNDGYNTIRSEDNILKLKFKKYYKVYFLVQSLIFLVSIKNLLFFTYYIYCLIIGTQKNTIKNFKNNIYYLLFTLISIKVKLSFFENEILIMSEGITHRLFAISSSIVNSNTKKYLLLMKLLKETKLYKKYLHNNPVVIIFINNSYTLNTRSDALLSLIKTSLENELRINYFNNANFDSYIYLKENILALRNA